MNPYGIKVSIDSLERIHILGESKRVIVHRIADSYEKTSEYRKLLESIEIDRDALRSLVMEKLADSIINKWIREQE